MGNYKAKFKIALIFFLVILIFAFLFLIFKDRGTKNANARDNFAQCLRDKGIVMYGAKWCPHCQKEKRAFGGSFRFVPYVECPEEPQKCLAQGIEGYPTWIFPQGKRLVGEQGLEKLSQESQCPLN